MSGSELRREIDPLVMRELEQIRTDAEYDRQYAIQLSTQLAQLQRQLQVSARVPGFWRRQITILAGLAAMFIGCWWVSPSLALIVLGAIFVVDPLLASWIGSNKHRSRATK